MDEAELYGEIEFEPEKFTIGPYTFEVLTISYMPLPLLMMKQAKNEEVSGQALWCGSLGVASYLLNKEENADYVKDSIVLELGAGTGVLSMLASKMGAKKSIATDHDPKSIDHMIEDKARNQADTMDVEVLDWFKPDLTFLTKLIDENDYKKFTILAGDVLYKKNLIQPFFSLVKLCFTTYASKFNEEMSMLLCHIPRAGVDHEIIKESVKEFDLDIFEINKNEWQDSDIMKNCPEHDRIRAQVYLVKLKKD